MASESKADTLLNKAALPKPTKLTELVLDLKKCSYTPKATVTATPSKHVWPKPIKLNFTEMQAGLSQPSRKNPTSRNLFLQGKVKKDPAARKTLSGFPRYGSSYIKPRISATYKAPQPTAKNQVQKSRFTIGPGQFITGRPDDIARRQKRNIAFGSTTNLQKAAEKKSGSGQAQTASTKCATKLNGGKSAPMQLQNKTGRVVKDLEQTSNMENSVSLVPLEDAEEKWGKEPSVFKSQFLICAKENPVSTIMQESETMKSEDNCALNKDSYFMNELKLLKEKLAQMDDKLDKIMHILNQNMSSDQKTITMKQLTNSVNYLIDSSTTTKETERAAEDAVYINSCADEENPPKSDKTVDSVETASSVLKDETSLAVTKSEWKTPMTDKKVLFKSPDQCGNVVESESICYSSRRKSARLQNKKAQNAYESLRKSTKLLITPLSCSAKKTRTPGRISKKVIAQLNELYCD